MRSGKAQRNGEDGPHGVRRARRLLCAVDARAERQRDVSGVPAADLDGVRLGSRRRRFDLFAGCAVGGACVAVRRKVVRSLRTPRAVYGLGLLLLGGGFSAAAFAQALWHLQLCVGLAAGLGGACLGNVANSLLLGRWFGPRLPTAMAVVFAASGIGTLIWLPLSQLLIDSYGWRGAYRTIGVALLIIAVPLLVLPWRRLAAGASEAVTASSDQTNGDWKLSSAMRHHAFWALFGTYFFTAVGMFCISAQVVAYLVEAGFPPLQAATAWGFSGVLLAIGMVSVSLLDGLLGRRGAILFAYGLSVAGIVMLWLLRAYPNLWLLAGFIICFGSTIGSRGPLISATAMSIFRGNRVGTIFGAITLGSGLGAALGSWSGRPHPRLDQQLRPRHRLCPGQRSVGHDAVPGRAGAAALITCFWLRKTCSLAYRLENLKLFQSRHERRRPHHEADAPQLSCRIRRLARDAACCARSNGGRRRRPLRHDAGAGGARVSGRSSGGDHALHAAAAHAARLAARQPRIRARLSRSGGRRTARARPADRAGQHHQSRSAAAAEAGPDLRHRLDRAHLRRDRRSRAGADRHSLRLARWPLRQDRRKLSAAWTARRRGRTRKRAREVLRGHGPHLPVAHRDGAGGQAPARLLCARTARARHRLLAAPSTSRPSSSWARRM